MVFSTNKKRCMSAIIVTTICLVALILWIPKFLHQGDFEAMTFGFCVALILLCGALLAFKIEPSKKGEMVYGLVVLGMAPIVSFFLVERVNNARFWELSGGVILMNLFCYFFIFALIYMLCNRAKWTVIIGTSLCFLFGVVNAVVMVCRGTPFQPLDLVTVRTALNVSKSYQFAASMNFIVGLITFAFIICLATKITFVHRHRASKWCVRGGLLVALVLGGIWFYQGNWVETLEIDEKRWEQKVAYTKNGIALGFCNNIRYLKMPDAPEGYAAELVQQIDQKVAQSANPVKKTNKTKPNIIAIMDETFSDLSVLGEFETNRDYMPFYHSMKENTITGNLYVSGLGGGTANTEFEFLTGNSMAFLPNGTVPYVQYVDQDTYSLVSTLEDQGYDSTAMHCWNQSGYNRNIVYPSLGFDHSYFAEDLSFSEEQFLRKYPTDEANFEALISLFENKGENPLFLFNVTMQNHGGYTDSTGIPEDQQITISGKEGMYPQTENYLSLIAQTDQALESLIMHFEQVDEPTIILFFGDHQPNIEDAFVRDVMGIPDGAQVTPEQKQQQYITPFFIWANYDIPKAYYDKVSANYLSNLVLDTAGLQKTNYQEFLDYAYMSLPVITAAGMIDVSGKYYNAGQQTPYDDAVLQYYQMLQYNGMFDLFAQQQQVFSLTQTKNYLDGEGVKTR